MRGVRLALILILAVCLAACGRAALHRQEAFVFGTRVDVTLAGLGEDEARPAIAAVMQEFDRLHRTYHAWKPSELSILNASIAAGKTQVVSPEMATLIADARRFAAAGDQLFDPGIGGLIALWGFQSDAMPVALPSAEALAAWRAARPGVADLQLDGRLVASRKAGVALDFGGYLKGVALDRATQILKARGVRNALINIGGNVMALGDKNGRPWRVGIQHPRQPGPLATIELSDGEAIGTSGDYQRYFEIGGRRYCHLLDPRSGMPVTHTQALSVLIRPREQAGTLSDVATKPLFIAGPDWPSLARHWQIEHVLRIDADGHLQVTAAMQRRLVYVGKEPPAAEIIP